MNSPFPAGEKGSVGVSSGMLLGMALFFGSLLLFGSLFRFFGRGSADGEADNQKLIKGFW